MPSMHYSRKPEHHAPDHRQDAEVVAVETALAKIAERLPELDEFLRQEAPRQVAEAQAAVEREEVLQLAGRPADLGTAEQAFHATKVKQASAILEREDLLKEQAKLQAKLPVVRSAAKEKAVLALRKAYKDALATALPLCQQAAAAEVALADISEQAVSMFPVKDHQDDPDGFGNHPAILPRYEAVRYQPDGEYVIVGRLAGMVERLEQATERLKELEARETKPGRR